MIMEEPVRQTRHQVARGTRPDAQDRRAYYLFKNVGIMRVTYQVRLLAFYAWREGKELVIEVPQQCRKGASLVRFMKEYPDLVRFERVS